MYVQHRFTLNQSAIKAILNRKVHFGFNGLGEAVYYRTYSRLKEDGKQETWYDTVIRVTNGVFSIRKDYYLKNFLEWDDDEYQAQALDFALCMFDMHFLPPGRGLWACGTDYVYERGASALNNCFAYETEIITADGIKQIGDIAGTYQKLLTIGGKWIDAPIKSFGQQQLFEIVFERYDQQKVVFATKDHQWFVFKRNAPFQTVTTENLTNGMKMRYMFGQGIKNINPSPFGIAHGFTFGDSIVVKKSNHQNGVYLADGPKLNSMKKYFQHCDEVKGQNGSLFNGIPNYFKELPLLDENKSYLLGWLMGYFAAEGTIKSDGKVNITSTTKDTILFVQNLSLKLGIPTINIQETRSPSLNGQLHTVYILTFARQLPNWFFVNEKHRVNYVADDRMNAWKVISVRPTDRMETVYCAEVADYNAFTLEGNILTHNCGFISTVNIVESTTWAMDMLMCGVGVGFDTQWDGVAKTPSETTFVFVVPDSREGWVDALRLMLESFCPPKKYKPLISDPSFPMEHRGHMPTYDVSQIRAKGEPIKGFGGLASGPGPLVELLHRVRIYLETYVRYQQNKDGRVVQNMIRTIHQMMLDNGFDTHVDGHKIVNDMSEEKIRSLTYDKTRCIADIINSIGRCVVAGNVRRCIPGYALVHARRGMVPIQDITTDDEVLTVNGFHRVMKTFVQGKQQLIQIVTENGTFDCTGNHRIAVYDQNTPENYRWVEAHYLTKNDRMIMCTQSVPGVKTQLPIPTSMWSFMNGNIKLPELDEDVAWLAGLLFMFARFEIHLTAFGYLNGRSKILVENVPSNVLLKVRQIACQFNIKNDSMVVTYDDNGYTLVFSDVLFMSYILDYWTLNHEFFVGQWIFCAENNIRNAYLKGITGTLPDVTNSVFSFSHISLYTKARDIQRLLFSCGVCSVLHKEASGYKVYLKTDVSTLNEYVFSGVKEVIPYIMENTYDIEVEENHNFYCEGYLVHNSAEIALGDPSDETFLNLKNWNDYPERSDISHLSNNTCVFSKTDDFELIPKIAERIRFNGEPGFCNMINIRRYGRIRDHSREPWTREQEQDEAIGCNPCSEIPLESGELCNIDDVMLPRCQKDGKFSEEYFERALKHATFYCSTISLLPTHHANTNKVIARNRRIGVALSGIAEFYTEVGFTRMTKYLRRGYRIVSQLNRQLAREAGIPESIRKTTVKPSGTISLLSGASAGMHFPTFKYAVRRVTVSKTAPINSVLIQNNVPYEESHWDKTSNVFEFLIDQGRTRAATDVSIWEQFQLLTTLQREWSDNMVSVTGYFNPETEGEHIEYCLAQNAPLIKSVSLLPHTDVSMYKQAPYTGITKEEYEKRLADVKPIDWSTLCGSDGMAPRYCNNDTCIM